MADVLTKLVQQMKIPAIVGTIIVRIDIHRFDSPITAQQRERIGCQIPLEFSKVSRDPNFSRGGVVKELEGKSRLDAIGILKDGNLIIDDIFVRGKDTQIMIGRAGIEFFLVCEKHGFPTETKAACGGFRTN